MADDDELDPALLGSKVDDFDCPVCFETTPVPHILSGCTHSMCGRCANGLLAAGRPALCPFCRAPFQQAREDESARKLFDLVTHLRAANAQPAGIDPAELERQRFEYQRQIEELQAREAQERERREREERERQALEDARARLEEELARERALHAQREQERREREEQERQALEAERARLAQELARSEQQTAHERELRTRAEADRERAEAERARLLEEQHNRIQELQAQIFETERDRELRLVELAREKEELMRLQQEHSQHAEQEIEAMKQRIAATEQQFNDVSRRYDAVSNMYRDAVDQLVTRQAEPVAPAATGLPSNAPGDAGQAATSGIGANAMATTVRLTTRVSGWFFGSNKSLVQSLSDLKVLERRGTSLDTRIWKAVRSNAENRMVALKKISFQRCTALMQQTTAYLWSSPPEVESLNRDIIATFREVMLLAKLKHPNILSLHGIAPGRVAGEYFAILPFYENDLEFLMDSAPNSRRYMQTSADYKKLFNPLTVQRIMRSILVGLRHLHSLDIVHRRLRPSVILLNNLQSTVVIGGFTHARSLHSSPLDSIQLNGQRRFISFDCAAPELLYLASERQPLANWKPIDMWAVGCIFIYMITGWPLFFGRTRERLLFKILTFHDCRPENETVNTLISNFPLLRSILAIAPQHLLQTMFPTLNEEHPHALDLLRSLLAFHPHARITVEAALAHPYFSATDIPAPTQTEIRANDLQDGAVREFYEAQCSGVL